MNAISIKYALDKNTKKKLEKTLKELLVSFVHMDCDATEFINIQIGTASIKIRKIAIDGKSLFIIHGTNTSSEFKPYCTDANSEEEINKIVKRLIPDICNEANFYALLSEDMGNIRFHYTFENIN